jgi:FAD:protein FMN transferase
MSCVSVRRVRPLLGTLVEISLSGEDETRLHAAADAAFSVIEQIHDLMSLQSADSEISRMNKAPAGARLEIDSHTWRVLALAAEIACLSEGAFDVTVGGAMLEHGGARPHEKATDPRATFRDIELWAPCRVRLRRSLVIDVGGIAKGYAVDAAVDALKDLGIPAGSVNAGGDIRAFGAEPVTVLVRDPGNPALMRAKVDLLDQALATSANYPEDTAFGSAGTVLDPRHGKAVRSGRSASVRARSCAVADALAKCVLLLGVDSAPALNRYGANGFVLDGDSSVVIDPDGQPERHGREKADGWPVVHPSREGRGRDIGGAVA